MNIVAAATASNRMMYCSTESGEISAGESTTVVQQAADYYRLSYDLTIKI